MNLTATHERNDGLTNVVKWFSGSPVIKTSKKIEENFNIEEHITVKIIQYVNTIDKHLFATY